MNERLKLGDIEVDVVLKDIKNVHLSVHPPTGRVSIVAPLRTKLDTIRLFAIQQLGWIRQQQTKIRSQERESPREYLDRESHYVWGKRYLMTVHEGNASPTVELQHSRMLLRVRPGATTAHRHEIVEAWYRRQLRECAVPLIARWEKRLGVKSSGLFVQRMKTRWGSCNPTARTIRLNTELARKPRDCVEYLVVHELAHLLEPTHNARFQTLMDKHQPDWKFRRQQLNRLPVRHADWDY